MRKVHFEFIPLADLEHSERELNQFLSSHRVLSIDREFVQADGHVGWALAVTYETSPVPPGDPSARRSSIDYKKELSPENFAVFAKLRDLRKRFGLEQGVQLYTIFTNEQLAAMVEQRVTSLAALGRIPGVGNTRLEKYGEAFLAVLCEALDVEDVTSTDRNGAP